MSLFLINSNQPPLTSSSWRAEAGGARAWEGPGGGQGRAERAVRGVRKVRRQDGRREDDQAHAGDGSLHLCVTTLFLSRHFFLTCASFLSYLCVISVLLVCHFYSVWPVVIAQLLHKCPKGDALGHSSDFAKLLSIVKSWGHTIWPKAKH